jgi:KUP system potassium uptake protein
MGQELQMSSKPVRARETRTGRGVLALGALGIVFGDIGTSPLYALQAAFSAENNLQVSDANVLGILSLFFWTLILVVTVKYVLLVMRADNDGEGGVMALMALASRRATRTQRGAVLLLGLAGVALFYGDGVITPAISVLSAMEGLHVAAPDVHRFVLPLTLVVLTVLFSFQHKGTGRISRAFGPIMLIWFVTIAVLGVDGIARNPSVLRAVDPLRAVSYVGRQPWIAFVSLGAVVLCITGVEALYADMGHFGRVPIATAWLAVVLPSLALCYFGQGALILQDPRAATNPFFHLTSHAWTIPLVVLATTATVIASQAAISGVFSLTQQAVQLGYLPRLAIHHTSEQVRGQIYLPAINWLLYVTIVGVVLGFGSSARLAAAYGIAVTGTMATTSVLLYVVTRRLWRWSTARALLVILPLLAVDLAFFAANLLKVHRGGWFPLLLGGALFVLMRTWDRGRDAVTRKRIAEEGPLREFVGGLGGLAPPLVTVPGTAVYPTSNTDTTPLALRINVEHNHIRHEQIVIFHAAVRDVPHVRRNERVVIDNLGDPADRVILVTAKFGYSDRPDVPDALERAARQSNELQNLGEATYFLSRIIIRPTRRPGMAFWRKRVFSALARNASSPADYFRLPPDQVVALGSQILI